MEISSTTPRHGTPVLQWLVVLAVVLPSVLLGGMAWRERVALLEQARSTAEHTVLALAEHTESVLDGATMLVRSVDRAIAGKSWVEISSDQELHTYLSSMRDEFASIASIIIVDAQGTVRATSLARGLGVSVDEQDYFRDAREHKNGEVFVSGPHTGRISGLRQFAVVLSRRTSAGEFDGLIYVGIPLAHFTSFWKDFAPTLPHVVPLVRADGELLARYPAQQNPARLSVTGPFLSRALVQPKGFYTAVSLVDGVERLNAYAKVGTYPLFISFSIEKKAVLAQWQARVAVYTIFAALATALLLALGVAAIARARREREATASWKRTAQLLDAEVAVRRETETRLRQAEALVSRRTEELSQLSQHLLSVRDEERATIARDIHDDIGGALTAIRIDIGSLRDTVANARSVPTDVWARIERTLGQVMIAHRRIINALHPSVLDTLGLEAALEAMLNECRQRHAPKFTLHVEGETARLPSDVSIAAYRLVQEAINNVVLHARATEVEVSVERRATAVSVTVTDNGIGYDPATATRGRLGLVGMRERALKLGGTFEIASHTPRGTRVCALFPLAATIVVVEPELRQARSENQDD